MSWGGKALRILTRGRYSAFIVQVTTIVFPLVIHPEIALPFAHRHGRLRYFSFFLFNGYSEPSICPNWLAFEGEP